MSFMRPEKLPSNSSVPNLPNGAPNPLKSFPAKSKPIGPGFRAMDATKSRNVKEIEKRNQWLQPDKVDPNFGITGDTREVMIRRSYRRLESASLFKPAAAQASLSEIVPSVGSSGRKFVLVEESRVAELARLESILREEKAQLGEQAVGVMSEFLVDARIPIPATRLAVQNLSEADQRGLVQQVTDLHVAWHNYAIRHNYDRMSAVHNKQSYVDRAPASLRALKLSKLVETNTEKVMKMERDTMMFEDDLSFLNGAYAKAQERVWDYDRYYVLANRYGYMSEEEYYKDDRPGRRYYLRAVDGALKFQGVWGMYWAIQRMRYRKGAMGFQKIIRGFLAWRKFHPLIIFRLKYGKRSYYEFCLHRWKEYIKMLRMCRVGIQWLLDREWIHKTFGAWKQYRIDSKEEKMRKAKAIFARIMSTGLFKCYQALKNNAIRQRYIKIKMRRAIGFPQFDMWCDYVDAVKHQKKIAKAATKMASVARMYFSRKQHKAKKKVGKVLGLMIRSRVVAIRNRKKALGESFKLWEMLETEQLTFSRTNGERKRLQKATERISELEKEELGRLRRHLKGGHGKQQLKMATGTTTAVATGKKGERARKYVADLTARTSHVCKSIIKHDLDARDPPFLVCVDPLCRSTFVTYNQYHLHHVHNPRHMRHFHEHKANLMRLIQNEEDSATADVEATHTSMGANAMQMMHLKRNLSKAEMEAEAVKEENEAIKESGEGDTDGANAATDAEREVITVSDFHLLLLVPKCRELMQESYTTMMNMQKPGQLVRSEVMTGKKTLAQLLAEAGSDSEDNSGDDENGEKKALLMDGQQTVQQDGGALVPAVDEDSGDEEEEDDDLIALQRQKEREDPIARNLRNAVQLYAAIQEWKRQTSDSYAYKSQAVSILDKFLVDPAPVDPVDLEPTEDVEGYEDMYDLSGYFSDESDDTVIREEKEVIYRNRAQYVKAQKKAVRMRLAMVSKVDFSLCTDHHGSLEVDTWLPGLVTRLRTLKNSTHRGYMKPVRLPVTCARRMLGMQGRLFNEWSEDGVVPGDLFEKLELQCFHLLYQHVTHKYYKFHSSAEYIEYRHWTDHQDERRLFDMYVRAKDIRLKEFEKWSREVYYPKHMAIYRVSDQVVDRCLVREADHVAELALNILVDEFSWLHNATEQAQHEHSSMLALEAVDWAMDALYDEWWDIYVGTAVKGMLDIDLVRGKLLIFAGLRKADFGDRFKKKLLVEVDMKATSGSLLDMLNDDAPEPEPVVAEPSVDGEEETKREDGKGKKSNKKVKIAASGPTEADPRGKPPKHYPMSAEEKEAVPEGPVPGINVINVSSSNYARWQAEKANKKSAAANDPRGEPPKHFPMSVKSEKHWDALLSIQRIARGVLGRNKARRVFAQTYVKKWDASYGACYYANVRTEASTWEPPLIYKHLYPGKTW